MQKERVVLNESGEAIGNKELALTHTLLFLFAQDFGSLLWLQLVQLLFSKFRLLWLRD